VKSYFDVERGCERKLIADETSTMESFDMSGGTAAKRTIKLKSVKKLSADDLKAWSARVKAFDTALCAAYSNDFGSASDLLGEQIGAETHPGWKSGLETVRTAVKQMVSFSSGGICSSPMMMEEEPIVQELAYAEQAVLMGDWDAAVNTYEKFVANQPDHDRVPEALATAAGICESELKDEARAKALWKKLVEVHEKAVPEDGSKPADPMALYKLAGALAGAGRSKESLTKYNEFIKDDNEGIPARLRLLARYRQARICEEAGKVESAIAVYRAVKKSKATDSYSKKLAAKAAEKIRELEGSGPEEETHE
jgi:tetratricopeptide (TPR) repeat protein